ncbi:hypothetical protein IV203_021749 [Nitzschia inconspicua]|uniref:J domain-containing protein n=1 Tax=Nitzschia inconspicua TaxID=303405 RepID=A0A9K3KI90_9STRA|nr:hypothetical protein IV203_021749 [Nitzschia inconspicua]
MAGKAIDDEIKLDGPRRLLLLPPPTHPTAYTTIRSYSIPGMLSPWTLIVLQQQQYQYQLQDNLKQQQQQQQQRHNLHQRLQFRFFDSRKARRRKKGKDPFKVLSMPHGSLYKDVKRKFLKIAMTNHPDTHSEDLTEEERDKMRDIFIEARIAFEALTEDTDGTAMLLSEKEKEDAMHNFDSWFKSETGLTTPFQFDMDPETMKEVAKMTEAIGGDSGLDRDGGMWALARMVTSAVKTGGDAASILRLESGGDVKGNNNNRNNNVNGGELRRRRKR